MYGDSKRWYSVHIHYYDNDVEAVILDCVRPTLRNIANDVHGAYFERHWKRGPHIRVNLCAKPTTFAAHIWPTLRDAVQEYLLLNASSGARYDPVGLLAIHQRLAALECEDGPLLPWHDDNSVRLAPYDGRAYVLGGSTAAMLRADFLSRTNDLAFEMLDQVRRGGQLLRLAFDLIVAVAHGLSYSGLPAGGGSLRAHAEGFLYGFPEGAGLIGGWSHHYARHAEALRQRVQRVTAALDGTGAPVAFVGQWVEILKEFRNRGTDLIESGQMSADVPPEVIARLPSLGDPMDKGPMSRAGVSNEWWVRVGSRSVWFAGYRLMLNYNYLHLTRLGVSPEQRFLLCFLAGRAIEDTYGISLVDLFGNASASLSHLKSA